MRVSFSFKNDGGDFAHHLQQIQTQGKSHRSIKLYVYHVSGF